MYKIIEGVLVASILFSLERGAEMMWPQTTPWIWWGITGILFFMWMVFRNFPSREERADFKSLTVGEKIGNAVWWSSTVITLVILSIIVAILLYAENAGL